MLTDPTERNQLRAEWRQLRDDAEINARFRRYAIDLMLDAGNQSVRDPRFLALSEAELHDYLEFAAESLGRELVRLLLFWMLDQQPTFEEWQAKRLSGACAVDEVHSPNGLSSGDS